MFNFQPGCLVRFRPGLLARTKARYRCFPPPSCCSFTPRHLASTLVMQPQPHPEWERIRPSKSSVPPFYAFAREIKRSEQDDRQYRVIQLDNGLQVTLVHDSKADKAAASLDVAVGHLNDPDDMPGLAHFCEHLLFRARNNFLEKMNIQNISQKTTGPLMPTPQPQTLTTISVFRRTHFPEHLSDSQVFSTPLSSIPLALLES